MSSLHNLGSRGCQVFLGLQGGASAEPQTSLWLAGGAEPHLQNPPPSSAMLFMGRGKAAYTQGINKERRSRACNRPRACLRESLHTVLLSACGILKEKKTAFLDPPLLAWS